MFLETNIKEAYQPSNKDGIVYVLDIDVDNERVVKIGITSRKIEDRVSEILVSYFKSYREFPYCRPKKFTKTEEIYEKEQMLLNYFSDYKYVSKKKFGGCQELVSVPLEFVVEAYEKVLNGEVLEGKFVLETCKDESKKIEVKEIDLNLSED